MPIISQFYGIKVSMFYSDHGEPHFHAYYGEYSAKIRIRDGDVMVGKLPERATRMLQVWCHNHRQELIDNWERALEHKVLNYVEPMI